MPGYRRLMEGFTRLARKVLALAGGPSVGQAIYLDTHIVKLYSAADIDRTKNASMAHPVKAILKLRAVSAQRGGRPVLFTKNAAGSPAASGGEEGGKFSLPWGRENIRKGGGQLCYTERRES
jgi:hypothetical protein